MNNKVLIFLVSLALAGCAEMGGMGVKAPSPNVNCGSSGADCKVTVTVTSNTTGGCSIDVPDVVDVKATPNGTNIRWEISGDNQFRFAQPNGIAFDKPTGPPPGPILSQNGSGGGRSVTLRDNHKDATTKGRWAYSVYVAGSGAVTCKYDPWVDNT
jgi:hypothetical protein